MRRILPALLLLFGMTATVYSQIEPPYFQCIKNDTLIWTPAPSLCGPFQAYVVYGARDPAGPYQELTLINDASQTRYFHAGAAGQTWYYYLATAADCPGQAPLNSDTLDNRLPLAGPLRYVSVQDDAVDIAWEPSASPEVIGYVISRDTPNGTIIVDTVYNQTSYIDTAGDPQNQSETYYVAAIDGCGNSSLRIDPHQTLLLQSQPPDSCNAVANLNWNAYQSTQGVSGYEVFVSVNGESYTAVAQLPGGQSTYGYDQGNDGEMLCFYVEAIVGGAGERARSSTTCVSIRIVQPVRQVFLLGADVLPDGSAALDWQWDANARLQTVTIDRDSRSIDYPFTQPVTATATYRDSSEVVGPPDAPTYRVVAEDECGNRVVSNPVRPIVLSGAAAGESNNVLNWTAFSNEYLTSIRYELIRIIASGDTVVFVSDDGALTFTDQLTAAAAADAGTCYYVRATTQLALPTGDTLARTLRSNVFCLEQEAAIYIPNVFMPTSGNPANASFRPFLGIVDVADYELQVFDRWGNQVFAGTAPDQVWDGTVRGRRLPTGVYLYYLRVVRSTGTQIVRRGTVTLLW